MDTEPVTLLQPEESFIEITDPKEGDSPEIQIGISMANIINSSSYLTEIIIGF